MRLIHVLVALVLLPVGCASDPEPAPAPAPEVETGTAPVTTTATPPVGPPAPPAADAAAKEAEDHCRIGMQYLNEGRHGDADQAFSRAIELTPDDAFPHAARALARNHMGKGEAAVEDVSKAISLAPADDAFVLDLYAFRGSVQTELERWQEGDADLTRCIEKGKDEVELRLSRGTCRLELGQLELALGDADSAITRAPDDDARGRGLWLRGLVHERAGRLDEALADLEGAAQAGTSACEDDLARVRAALGR